MVANMAFRSAVMAENTSESAELPGREEGRLPSERRREGEREDSRGFSASLAALMITECDLREFLSGKLMPSMVYNSSCTRSRALVSDVGVAEKADTRLERSVMISSGRRRGMGGTGGMSSIVADGRPEELVRWPPMLLTDDRRLEERRPALETRMLDFFTASTRLDRLLKLLGPGEVDSIRSFRSSYSFATSTA